MALTLTVTRECQGGVGYAHLTAISGPGGRYNYTLTRRSDSTVVDSSSIARADLPLDFDSLYDDTYELRLVDITDASNSGSASFALACGYPNPGGGGGDPDPDPDPQPGVTGCMAPNALNYDPTATQDSTPTACVFVAVDEAPAGLVAAHLPIPLVLRASPTLAGVPAIVVLVLEAADTPAGPWAEFGQLRAICDEGANATFNLSEAAKSRFTRIAPPVESGLDPSLSALIRVCYQVYDPVTREPTYAGTAATFRALNAVVQPTEGAALTTPTPYASVPVGGRLWTSSATYAAGVRSATLPRPTDGCQARQFVWLNAAGVWDSGFFGGRHQHGTDQTDAIGFRDTAGDDRYASRGSVRDTLSVFSDLVDWRTYGAIRFIRKSVQVYERLGPGQYVPVRLGSESFPEYTEQTDKTFQVNFTVSYPAQLIQTQ